MRQSSVLTISEMSQVGEARRQLANAAVEAGLSEGLRGRLAIAITELATNLVKHTRGGGRLVYRIMDEDGLSGMEILALDQGPGMEDVSRCMRDGFSTAGSPGTGLGAIRRMSDVFDIHSVPGTGTALLLRLLDSKRPSQGHLEGQERPQPQVGAVCIPYPGETLCGDSWAVRSLAGERPFLMVVDGLGHGPLAAAAARGAVEAFGEQGEDSSASEVIRGVHLAIRSTRGAAVATARLDLASASVQYAGLGNISGMVLTPDGDARRMVSHNGTAGMQLQKVQDFRYPWSPQSVLVMHSDGLTSNWDLGRLPGLLSHHPSLIAGVIYRDFNRGRDDATVLVVSSRWRAA